MKQHHLTVRAIRTTVATVLVTVLAGCSSSVAPGPNEDAIDVRVADPDALPTEVVLAPREAVRFGVFEVAFLGVDGDSRCPLNAFCVWQGNAEVELGLTLGTGPTYPFTVNTGIEPRFAEHGGYRVTLLNLVPVPELDVEIDPRDYRATLRVERIEPD